MPARPLATVIVFLFPLVFLAACGGGQGGSSPPDLASGKPRPELSADSPAAPPAAPRSPALESYYAAKEAIISEDLESAVRHLQRATAQDPNFAEAWYQLGAAEVNLVVREVASDESRARDLFRQGVTDKRRSEELMRAGSFRVWTPPQQEQGWSDLQNGLEGVDEFLSDDETLTAALRLYASGTR